MISDQSLLLSTVLLYLMIVQFNEYYEVSNACYTYPWKVTDTFFI